MSTPQTQEPEQYIAGVLTMQQVFRPAGLTNLADMQAVLDAVERALEDAWHPMTTAPKGTFRCVPAGKGASRQVHEPEFVILALAENQTVIRSRWLPEDQRWEGISKERNTPIGWKHWPSHPLSKLGDQQ